MAYRLIFGNQQYKSSDFSSTVETSDGRQGIVDVPLDGGPLPDSIRGRLPVKYIVKSGSTTREFARCGTEFFTVTNAVKAALKPFAAGFEFFPLSLLNIPPATETEGELWLLYPPDRAQVINLKATGDALVVEQIPAEMINGKLVEFPRFYRVRDYGSLVVDRRALEGLHLWKGSRVSLSSSWFCSEAFKTAVEQFRRSFEFEFVREE